MLDRTTQRHQYKHIVPPKTDVLNILKIRTYVEKVNYTQKNPGKLKKYKLDIKN